MPPQPLATRVERLEQRMTALEELPRVEALESQIGQLRGEMHGEFAALRTEMRAGDEETRRVLREELRGEIGQVRGEIGQCAMTSAPKSGSSATTSVERSRRWAIGSERLFKRRKIAHA